ncbi:MAG: homoserine O-acetyltransferase, partial [Bacteroidetes bacterium]
MQYNIYTFPSTFITEQGRELHNLQLAYHSFGQLNAEKNNAVWVFHALTANSNATEWWAGLVGEGKLFCPSKYFIICVNMLGSPYGSTQPLSIDTTTGKPYYHSFPLFTINDLVHAYDALRKYLGIAAIHIGIGGSMGGQQLLQWAVNEPTIFEHIIPIATNTRHSAWGIAFNSSQRMAIEADASWNEQRDDAGLTGMQVARSIALLSYRNYKTYGSTQDGVWPNNTDHTKEEILYRADTYQRYQGKKLAARFNAFSYYFLSKTMDSHDVARNKSSIQAALAPITARALVLAIEGDILFP